MSKLTINVPDKTYTILIENGAAHSLLTHYQTDNDVVIITDDGIPTSLVETVQNQLNPVATIVLPQGEVSKTLDAYHEVVSTLLQHNLSKTTTLVALGGGVIGDLTGFIASTYARGIHFIQIPTTLLAMVDSSIGGKTALNINTIKNVVGSFYHPDLVIIDPTILDTLPKRHFANGMAEVIKMAVVADQAFAHELLGEMPIATIIKKAITIKKHIVEKDPNDTYERHLLNFGHTIAHAIEAHAPTLLHGECVAIGMMKMAKGEAYAHTLESLCVKYNIPIDCSIDPEILYNHILHDKKIRHKTINIALVESLGNGYIKPINIEDVKRYL